MVKKDKSQCIKHIEIASEKNDRCKIYLNDGREITIESNFDYGGITIRADRGSIYLMPWASNMLILRYKEDVS